MKKIISILSAVVLFVAVASSTAVSAEDQSPVSNEQIETIQPRYQYITVADCVLMINGNQATCTSRAVTSGSSTSITVTQYLEMKTLWWWDYVGKWSKTTYSTNICETQNIKSGLSGGTYRLRTVYTVSRNGNTEEIEKISAEKTI